MLILFVLLVVGWYLLKGTREDYQTTSPGTIMQLVLRNKQDDLLLANAFQAQPMESNNRGLLGDIGYSSFNPMGYRRLGRKNYYQKRLSTVGH